MVCQDKRSDINFRVSILNEIPLIEMPGSIGKSELLVFQEFLQQLCSISPSRIVLDFSQTILIDAENSDILLNNFKKINEKGIEIVVWSLHKPIMKAIINMGITPFVSFDLETNINLPLNVYHPSTNESRSPLKIFRYYSNELKLFFERIM